MPTICSARLFLQQRLPARRSTTISTTKSYAAYANGSYRDRADRAAVGRHPLHPGNKDYFRTTVDLLLAAAGRSTATFAVRAAKDNWNDTSPMASSTGRSIAVDDGLCARRQGLQIGRLQRPRQHAAESTEYDPETVWSYEAGFKTTIANQLRLNGAVFYNDYKDFQARVSGIDDRSGHRPSDRRRCRCSTPASCASRAPSSKPPGPRSSGLLIDGQLGYLDAKYKEFADVRFSRPAAAARSRRRPSRRNGRSRLGAQYAFDLGGAGRITVGGQIALQVAHRARRRQHAYQWSRRQRTIEVPGLFQNGYWLHDARIVWENAEQAFRVGALRPEFDRRRPTRPTPRNSPSVGSIRTVYYGAPRTVTLQADRAVLIG